PSGDAFIEDFKSFQGVVGEVFRILNKKNQAKFSENKGGSKLELKNTIINSALHKVETDHNEEFKDVLTKLFFDEEHNLIKFHINTLYYMSFYNSNTAGKEISKFIFDIYLNETFNTTLFSENSGNENLLHQLVIQCLPELTESNFKTRNTDYINLIPEIREQLIEDFCHLSNSKSFFLKHVEDFFK